MPDEERQSSDLLGSAVAALAGLAPEDRDALVRTGVTMETALSQAPLDSLGTRELVTLCLECLQALYLDTVSDRDEACRALRCSAAVLTSALRVTDQLAETAVTLRSLLRRTEPMPPATDGDCGPEPADLPVNAPPTDGLWLDISPPLTVSSAERVERDALVTEFLLESYESLDQLDFDLVTLEQTPGDSGMLPAVFRALHTIKGNSGCLGFTKLEALTHACEELLGRLRDGEISNTTEITGLLLAIVDAVRELLGRIETEGNEGEGEYNHLIQAVAHLKSPAAHQPAQPTIAPESEAFPERFGDLLVRTGRIDAQALAGALQAQKQGDPRHIGEILVEQGVLQPWEVADTLRLQEETRARVASDTSIRVEVTLIDRMTALVEELAEVSDRHHHGAPYPTDPNLLETRSRLRRVTVELQECLLQCHSQPIGSLWCRYPRMVRDLALACGKQVRVEMFGTDIGLEKRLLEAIKDPLTHVIRNAVDHGIETPAARAACGKPADASLVLSAVSEGGWVTLQIADDGAGIDPERVRRRVVEQGLLTPEQASSLGPADLMQLIFLPGFSTRENVSHLSGRGVGLDVVKTNIDRIGGAIEIESLLGHGTTFRIRLPDRPFSGEG